MNRDNKGKFARAWKIKGFILVAFSVALLTVGHFYVEPAIDRANAETRAFLDKTSKKLGNDLLYVAGPRAEAAEIETDLEKAKEKTIDILEKCESGGHPWEEGFIKLDSNDKLSYAGLQFQKTTVQHYVEKRTGKKISGYEAVLIAMDREKARDLAKWIIFEDKGVDSDWVICSRNFGLQARVDIIKELEN